VRRRKHTPRDEWTLFALSPEQYRQPESATQKQIKDYCKARNILCFRMNAGGWKTPEGNWIEGAPSGTPDLYILYKGCSLWVEVKKIGEQPRTNQDLMHVHAEIRRSGGIVIVAERLEDVSSLLNEIDHRRG
jgi:hypothetical protein